ncbi:MAG: hypothetical protein ACF8AM_14295 [Rhodopirellula sp. JB055]|uniref:hypothetical protein n=1 Tax=Rhodopirellula sp. JB055 TaxID=3342846 RepID=UPI00370A39EB
MDKLTRKAVASICGVTPPRIGQLVDEGVIDRNKDGSYPRAAITQYVRFIRKDYDQNADFRELLEQERYREMKRENDRAESHVATVAQLEDATKRGVAAMVTILDRLPATVRQHWPGVSKEQIQMVNQAVSQCRDALADVAISFDDE